MINIQLHTTFYRTFRPLFPVFTFLAKNSRHKLRNKLDIVGAYKLPKYFVKRDDGCIICNEIVHTTFESTFQKDHDVQIAVRTRVEPPQISGHTNYAWAVRQPFPSNTGLRFSREMAIATMGPFQMLRSLCVIDRNFTILQHFLLKLWSNEILR
jgi:hypothetical protein